LLGIAVHLILPQITRVENSWQVLTSMALWAVGLAFIAQGLSYLGSGFLLQSILAIAHQKVSLWLNTLIVLGSASIGMFAGGMFAGGTVGSSAAIYRWTSGNKGSMEWASRTPPCGGCVELSLDLILDPQPCQFPDCRLLAKHPEKAASR
jgi:hypothetical protein